MKFREEKLFIEGVTKYDIRCIRNNKEDIEKWKTIERQSKFNFRLPCTISIVFPLSQSDNHRGRFYRYRTRLNDLFCLLKDW